MNSHISWSLRYVCKRKTLNERVTNMSAHHNRISTVMDTCCYCRQLLSSVHGEQMEIKKLWRCLIQPPQACLLSKTIFCSRSPELMLHPHCYWSEQTETGRHSWRNIKHTVRCVTRWKICMQITQVYLHIHKPHLRGVQSSSFFYVPPYMQSHIAASLLLTDTQ